MSETSKGANRRVRTNLPLTWKATFVSTVQNLSRGGLYFRCAQPPQIGTMLEIDFNLPGDPAPIQAQGIVRWTSANSMSAEIDNLFGVGIEFQSLTTEHKSKLENFVEQSSHERRNGTRQNVRLVVEYMFAGESYRTIANELGRRGMFLVTDNPLELDDTVQVKFRLPELHAQIKAQAIVRWRHDSIPPSLTNVISPGMGLQFLNISDEDLEVIAQYLDASQTSNS